VSEFVFFALLGLFIVASVFALAAGIACFLNAGARALKREWRKSIRLGLIGALLVLIPVWLWASVFAEMAMMRELHHCQENLGRAIYPTLLEYRLRHPGAPLPSKWPRPDREPVCTGSGEPLPYVYLPVPDLNEAASANPPGWLAHCPKRHQRSWWVPGVLSHRGRVVLDASGRAIQVTEEEFQVGLRHPGQPQAHK